MPEQIIRIASQPGIKRDGTKFEGDAYVDGQWMRFQRGLPRKVGGYRSINKYLQGVVRTLHEYTQDQLTYIHGGSSSRIEQFYIDGNYNTSVISNRTPTSLTASDANLWQFDVETTAATAGLQIVAQVAPNLNCICNSLGGQLFYGDLFGSGPLTEVTTFPSLPVGSVSLTGGVVSLHPFTFVFGNDGFIMWSPDCADFTVTDAGYAYVTGQKIVRGMPLRGGPGNSPSGLFWSADSLVRASYVGGTQVFQFDTISSQSSIMSAQSVIEYDGIFYWIGSDRFLSFNGVVREVENNLNQNFFFDNVNMAYRQKVFAFKVPRFGEIWWCFPFGDSTEPDWAVIYNVRDNTWYDTPLPNGGRSAGLFPAVFRKPLMAGSNPYYLTDDERITESGGDERITETDGDYRVTEESGEPRYKFWVHEVGTDEIDGIYERPIQSFFETADISIPAQQGVNNATQVLMLEPDFVQSGPMTVQVRGRANARAPEVNGVIMTFEDTATLPQEQVVFLKTQRRELRFRFESFVLGGDYQMGFIMAHIQPGDGTTLG